MSQKVKVILIGATATGKTSIIRQFVLGEFLETHFTTPIPVHSKKSDVENVDLVIWDTAGSEEWVSMNTVVYHGSDVVIYVASYDSRESLQELSTVWVSRLSQHLALDQVVKVLAVNKSDLIRSEDAVITEADVRAVSEQLGVEFISVSAKDNQGITELFSRVATLFKTKTPETKLPLAPIPVPVQVPVPIPKEEKKPGCC
jgi:small GTP-binding protein